MTDKNISEIEVCTKKPSGDLKCSTDEAKKSEMLKNCKTVEEKEIKPTCGCRKPRRIWLCGEMDDEDILGKLD